MKMTDENLIKDDFEAKIRTIVRPETVMSALSEDEDAVEMFDAFGFDIEELATNVCNAITFEVKSVKVDGDKTILTVAVTTPDFENSDDYFDKKLEEKFAGTNVNSASMESLFKAFGELVNEMFTDPDMPKTTQDEEVEYEKVNGEWKMVDENLNAEWLNL